MVSVKDLPLRLGWGGSGHVDELCGVARLQISSQEHYRRALDGILGSKSSNLGIIRYSVRSI